MADGLVQGPGEPFEERFCHVVGVAAIQDPGMEIGGEIVGKGTHEFLHQLEGESADGIDPLRNLMLKKGAAAEIQDDPGESFVHGKQHRAVADNAMFIPEGLTDGLTEDDAGVFHRVMEVHMKVPFGAEGEVDQAMFGKKRQHVIEEPDPGVNIGLA